MTDPVSSRAILESPSGDGTSQNPAVTTPENRKGNHVGRLSARPYQPGDMLPALGSLCLVSGANCDVESDQHRSYSWRTVIGYGEGDMFICLQTEGCWPTVERTATCWFAEIPTPRDPVSSRLIPDPRDERIKALEAERMVIRDNIPMEYLRANDAPGATGPTDGLNLGQAMRDFAAARWRLIERVKEAEAKLAALTDQSMPVSQERRFQCPICNRAVTSAEIVGCEVSACPETHDGMRPAPPHGYEVLGDLCRLHSVLVEITSDLHLLMLEMPRPPHGFKRVQQMRDTAQLAVDMTKHYVAMRDAAVSSQIMPSPPEGSENG